MNQSKKKMNKPLSSSGSEISLNLLIRVDENGREVGVENKEKCHQGEGIRHRAFLIMIFDRDRRLLLAKRSRLKKLWPCFWDGTVAGHYFSGSHHKNTPRVRIGQELGTACDDLRPLFEFLYEARYKDLGIEKEVCHVFAANHHGEEDVAGNREEVSELSFLEIPELSEWVRTAPGEFTPWFLLAFRKGRDNGLF
jgi:isopentenyl-diphosphate delta-isomerase